MQSPLYQRMGPNWLGGSPLPWDKLLYSSIQQVLLDGCGKVTSLLLTIGPSTPKVAKHKLVTMCSSRVLKSVILERQPWKSFNSPDQRKAVHKKRQKNPLSFQEENAWSAVNRRQEPSEWKTWFWRKPSITRCDCEFRKQRAVQAPKFC